MKLLHRLVLIILILAVSAGAVCETALFRLPPAYEIGSQAFQGIAAVSVFIPKETVRISPDAFSDTVTEILGFSGSAAQRFAEETGRTFIPVDITDIVFEAPQKASTTEEITVRLSCGECPGTLDWTLRLTIGGSVRYSGENSTGEFSFTLDNPGVYSCAVTVSNGYDSREITYENALEVCAPVTIACAVEYYTGTKTRFSAVTYPTGADLIWSSSDETVCGIDSDTGAAVFTNPGSAVIRAVLKDDPEAYAEKTVTVLQGAEAIDITAPARMAAGETCALEAVCMPEDAAGEITWYCGSQDVLTVTADGSLTALRPGSATVYARSANGCTASVTVEVTEAVTGLYAIQTSAQLNTGAGFSLSGLLRLTPSGADKSMITYSSSDSSIASVDEAGTVTAHKAGSCIVTASLGSLQAAVKVTVLSAYTISTPPVISPSTASVQVGGEVTFTPVWMNGVSDSVKKGEWYCEDSSVAVINSVNSAYSVKVKGVSAGTTELTFVTADCAAVTCVLTVTPVAAEGITLNLSEAVIRRGEQAALTCSLTPADSTEEISWSSSDTAVAVVDAYGCVTAVSSGECVITAVTSGGMSAACAVTVPECRMTSAAAPETISGNAGSGFTVDYTFEPAYAAPSAFRWTSSDESIVYINQDTGCGRFMSEGTAVLHGIASDGSGIELYITAEVKEIPVTGLVLASEAVVMTAGDTLPVYCRVLPADASWAVPVFTTSDAGVAYVTDDGVLTAIGEGICEITVTAGRAAYQVSESFSVTVERRNNAVYRALIAGEYAVTGDKNYLPFSANGTRGVYDALMSSRIDSKAYEISFMPSDPKASEIKAAIDRLAEVAGEDDVTVIYIIAHGHYKTSPQQYAFSTVYSEYVYDNVLIEEIKKISGHVVLCLCTCHSGRILESTSAAKLRAAGGVYQGQNGEGRLSIITSSTDTVSSYYNVSNPAVSYDFFTKAFTQGLGWDMIADAQGDIAADADGDRQVTVSELSAFARTRTQSLISAFIQQNGTSAFYGNAGQCPSRFIADGESDLVIFGR